MTDWIKWNWTPEKPYPETLDTDVFVKFRDGTIGKCKVGHLHRENRGMSNWHDNNDDCTVIEYRVTV